MFRRFILIVIIFKKITSSGTQGLSYSSYLQLLSGHPSTYWKGTLFINYDDLAGTCTFKMTQK